MSIGKAIAIIGGVAVGAVGAYNFSTTGCFLGSGSCSTDTAAVSAVAGQAADAGDACALGCAAYDEVGQTNLVRMDTAESESCCSSEGEAVAQTDEMSCCSTAKAAAVLAVAETTECAEASSCCSAESTEVADAGSCCSEAGADKAECDASECAKGDACCQAVASKDD